MHWSPKVILARAQLYVQRRGLNLEGTLGRGDQGEVFALARPPSPSGAFPAPSALKILAHEHDYICERDVYFRLRELNIDFVCDCAVPTLVDHDDTLLAIEMEIVARPCIIDFASACLDVSPEHAEEILELGRASGQAAFGPTWPTAHAIMKEFASYGIYLKDISPNNIMIL